MVWVGVIIVILTFVLIIKKFNARMVLFVAGLIMCLCAGQFMAPFEKFFTSFFTGNIPQIISAAVGYAYLMSYTKCDLHLCIFLVNIVKKAKAIIVPGTMIAAGLVIFALQSNAGTAAALGPVFIPVMIKAGLHPAFAATVLALGAHGSYLGFGNAHAAIISEISGMSVPEITITKQWPMAATAYIIMLVYTMVVGKMKKEDRGFVDEAGIFGEEVTIEKVSGYRCFLPFLPVILVILNFVLQGRVSWFPNISVQIAMLMGAIVTIITLRPEMNGAIDSFAKGIGSGMADVVSIIACAGVFTQGMESIGLTPAMLTMMESNPSLAVWGSSIAPVLISFLSGSGDAATLAFNGSVTPMVSNFGLDPNNIGTLAHLCGCYGRTFSPLAGVTIICAGFAKVDPMEITKRAIVPCLLSAAVAVVYLGFIVA